jgi:tetratricopeptide (TPR) repeat protein
MAETLLTQSLERARQDGDAFQELKVLYQLGNTCLRMGGQNARSLLEESLRLAQATDDRIRGARAMVDLGVLASFEANWADAERLMLGALAIARECGAKLNEGRALRRLAELCVARGDGAKAREYARAAIAILERTEDTWYLERARETLRRIEASLHTEGDRAP